MAMTAATHAVSLPVAAFLVPGTPLPRGGTGEGTAPHTSHVSHTPHPVVKPNPHGYSGVNGRGWDRTQLSSPRPIIEHGQTSPRARRSARQRLVCSWNTKWRRIGPLVHLRGSAGEACRTGLLFRFLTLRCWRLS